MKIKEYKCLKCANDSFFFNAKKDNVIGIYCDKCGAFLKWASKDEKNLMFKGEQK